MHFCHYTEINQLLLDYHTNLVRREAKLTLGSYYQWGFPFSCSYLNAAELDYRDLTGGYNLDKEAVEKEMAFATSLIDSLYKSYRNFQKYITSNHEILEAGEFYGRGPDDEPFYWWKSVGDETNSTALIDALLSGENVQFYADARYTPERASAVKFNRIELQLVHHDADKQTEFNKDLEYYYAEMKHTGE